MGARFGRRRLLHGLAGTAVMAMSRPVRLQAEEGAREAMARAALAFVGTLDPRRTRQATFSFGDAERLNWHYVPRRREGLPLKDMTSSSRAAAHALLQAGLSAVGYAKASDVVRLEGVLRQLDPRPGER